MVLRLEGEGEDRREGGGRWSVGNGSESGRVWEGSWNDMVDEEEEVEWEEKLTRMEGMARGVLGVFEAGRRLVFFFSFIPFPFFFTCFLFFLPFFLCLPSSHPHPHPHSSSSIRSLTRKTHANTPLFPKSRLQAVMSGYIPPPPTVPPPTVPAGDTFRDDAAAALVALATGGADAGVDGGSGMDADAVGDEDEAEFYTPLEGAEGGGEGEGEGVRIAGGMTKTMNRYVWEDFLITSLSLFLNFFLTLACFEGGGRGGAIHQRTRPVPVQPAS